MARYTGLVNEIEYLIQIMTQLAARFSLPLTLGLLGLGVAYSCSTDTAPDRVPFSPERQEVLRSAADCSLRLAADFEETAKRLSEELDAYAEDPDDTDQRDEARTAWAAAMQSWQVAEVAQFGPAGRTGSVESGGAVGGMDLRDQIYSWPLINSCRIDRALVESEYEDSVSALEINAKGLDALEYLLFSDGDDSTCPATVDIIADGTWDEVDDLDGRRADYAAAIGKELLNKAEELHEAWSEDGDDFYTNLVEAGQSGSYPSQADALDAVVRALIQVDVVVKDLKLAEPMGLGVSCTDEQCPEDFEHQFAAVSKTSITSNIEGFSRMYHGCEAEAYAFDELLKDTDAESIDAEIQAALRRIDDALSDIDDDDLRIAQTEQREELDELYAAVKSLTDILKNEFTDTLGTILHSVGGDND